MAWLPWVGFLAFVVGMLALDLAVFNRKAHVVSTREALAWSAVWIGLGLAFGVGVWVWLGADLGLQYFAGYLIEKSLSVDNLFLFMLAFGYFAVPAASQQRVLLWGVIGALVMRAVFIVVGTDLVHRFSWTLYAFGALLVVSGLRMALKPDGVPIDLQNSLVMRAVRRLVPVTSTYHGEHFFVHEAGRWHATPLFLALVAIETGDLVFAVDSIPAIFAVSRDPFIIYTSNVFAILGLRALYFALVGALDRLHLFKYGLAVVLVFVGAKMLLADLYKIPTWAALGAIAAILGGTALASLVVSRPAAAAPPPFAARRVRLRRRRRERRPAPKA